MTEEIVKLISEAISTGGMSAVWCMVFYFLASILRPTVICMTILLIVKMIVRLILKLIELDRANEIEKKN